jgi:hypothetical protein
VRLGKVAISRDRRHFRTARRKNWHEVAGLYHAQECPDCLAWVREPVRYRHEDWHDEWADWAANIHRAILTLQRAVNQLARETGSDLHADVDIEEPDGGEEPSGKSFIIS